MNALFICCSIYSLLLYRIIIPLMLIRLKFVWNVELVALNFLNSENLLNSIRFRKKIYVKNTLQKEFEAKSLHVPNRFVLQVGGLLLHTFT